MPVLPISKIVSGGQTGVDRAALDVAIFLNIEHGGWCPLGRRSESGRIPAVYQLQETEQRDYAVRTERNVVDSDGTLILFRSQRSGGTELTYRLALKHNRPNLCIDLNSDDREVLAREALCEWIREQNVCVMNVAGPRESTSPGITQAAESFLIDALRGVAS